MKRRDIAKLISKNTGVSLEVASIAANAIINEMKISLIKGDEVYLRGFGRLTPKVLKARLARDIGRDKTISIEAQNTVKFIVSQTFKGQLNEK